MTTWSEQSKSRVEHYLARENDENLLRENGDYLLIENTYSIYRDESKNTSTWSNITRNTATWANQAKS